MQSLPNNTALILIDVQQGFADPKWGARNNPQAETNMARLLTAWRDMGRPIVHIQHHSTEPDSPLRPGQAGNAIQSIVAPLGDEPIIGKQVNSAFIGTDLDERLRQQGINTLVCVGLTTNHCVSTTVRMAGNLGYTVYVVDDATATFDRVGHKGEHYPAQMVHDIALANLHGEFATVVTTAQILG